jgi:hypothetical protein
MVLYPVNSHTKGEGTNRRVGLCGYKYQVRELVPNRPGALVGQLPELVVTSSEEYWNW